RAAEVAAGPAGGLVVPQGGGPAARGLLAQALVRAVAVEQGRPDVHLPRLAPARAAVAPAVERDARRGRELRRRGRRDRAAREERPQVAHVPEGVVRPVEVLLPLLVLAPLSDAQAPVESGVAPGAPVEAPAGR